MKRTPFLVVVPVMLGGAFLLLLAALVSRMVLRPSQWREQVDYYVNNQPGLSFVSASPAAQPKEFREEMSGATYSRYGYRTDFTYEDLPGTSKQGSGTGPVPYPPQEVWCVTLARAGGAGQTMIFVALHEYDMQQGEWMTHEARGDANATAAAIGCK